MNIPLPRNFKTSFVTNTGNNRNLIRHFYSTPLLKSKGQFSSFFLSVLSSPPSSPSLTFTSSLRSQVDNFFKSRDGLLFCNFFMKSCSYSRFVHSFLKQSTIFFSLPPILITPLSVPCSCLKSNSFFSTCTEIDNYFINPNDTADIKDGNNNNNKKNNNEYNKEIDSNNDNGNNKSNICNEKQ
eukprot:Pgem_evm1s11073